MAKPLAPVSAWASSYVEEPDAEVIEGEIVDERPAVDQVRALKMQAMGLLCILGGFVLANGTMVLFPIDLLTVPIGVWLVLRGIRLARESRVTATRTRTAGSADSRG